MSGRVRVRERFAARRAAVEDWIGDLDLSAALSGLAFVVVCGGIFLLILIVAAPEPESVDPTKPVGPRAEEAAPRGPVEHRNRAGGYGFTFPAAWDLHEDGPRSIVESADGRIAMSFEPGPSGAVRAASARLLESSFGAHARQHLIGTTWTSIGGSRSLLVSGTASDRSAGAVRFLAILVPGPSRNYAITISVPAGSNPTRTLRRLEEIVASFEMVEPNAEAL
jgi:hypothetical protein